MKTLIINKEDLNSVQGYVQMPTQIDNQIENQIHSQLILKIALRIWGSDTIYRLNIIQIYENIIRNK
jgi:hypothetical protein